MRVGVISDTHDSLNNLDLALAYLRKEGVTTLIHCGDLTSANTARKLRGFDVIHALGNGDTEVDKIHQVLTGFNPNNFSGLIYTGEIDGVRLAVTHGHLSGLIEELLQSGIYRYVFSGHTHQKSEKLFGKTWLINPGALYRAPGGEHSFYLLDLASGEGNFITLASLRG